MGAKKRAKMPSFKGASRLKPWPRVGQKWGFVIDPEKGTIDSFWEITKISDESGSTHIYLDRLGMGYPEHHTCPLTNLTNLSGWVCIESHWGVHDSRPICPACEADLIMEGDYLCHKCRFGS